MIPRRISSLAPPSPLEERVKEGIATKEILIRSMLGLLMQPSPEKRSYIWLQMHMASAHLER
jgi:hypothetical protein